MNRIILVVFGIFQVTFSGIFAGMIIADMVSPSGFLFGHWGMLLFAAGYLLIGFSLLFLAHISSRR